MTSPSSGGCTGRELGPGVGTVHRERAMSSPALVTAEGACEHPLKMTVIKENYMIEGGAGSGEEITALWPRANGW